MINLDIIASIDEFKINKHALKIIELKQDKINTFVATLINIIPDHYIDPESIAKTLERLGKPAAAQKLRIKLPQTKKIRSGDLGEILATTYIDNNTSFSVPIKKLRWHDHREMAMRGDDVIGIKFDAEDQSLLFLKAEAKSRVSLSRDVMREARTGLDLDDGKPAPHALAFVIDRLSETGNQALADQIEEILLTNGVNNKQVKHLLFTFSGSNPKELHKEALEGYQGNIRQEAVGLRIKDHQQFISSVYEGVNDGLND